jgi:glycosyltransferase
MRLSIVSPTFNCVDRLHAHIASVEAQCFRDFEHILVDNLSTDGTSEAIAEYAARAIHPVIHLREADRGLYAAMNKGIRRARGEWVHVFNSDNIYSDKTVLERVFGKDLDGYDMVICGADTGSEGTDRASSVYLKPECDPSRGIYHFPHQGMLIRRDFYERHGLYDERFRIVSDCIFIFRNCSKAKFLVLDLSLAHLPGGGISGRPSFRNTWETELLLFGYHPAPFGQRLRDAMRQVLQYVRYGLFR